MEENNSEKRTKNNNEINDILHLLKITNNSIN